jgi:membrane protein DedA with SNARE-associated domain
MQPLGKLKKSRQLARQQATLAQLVERLIRNQQVAGSIPAGGSSLFNHLRLREFLVFALLSATLSAGAFVLSLVVAIANIGAIMKPSSELHGCQLSTDWSAGPAAFPSCLQTRGHCPQTGDRTCPSSA